MYWCYIGTLIEINPIHMVLRIPKGARVPDVLVTAYRPDPVKCSNDLSQPAVSLSVKRGEKIAKENQYSSFDDTNL